MASPRYKSAKFYTHNDYLDIDECFCGKKAFKYNDTSRNIFIAKCSQCSQDFDLKSKKWTKSKKQPCDFFCIYHGPRPVFKEIVNVIKTVSIEKQVSPDKALEDRLKLFFKFLFVSNHTSTLDEINLLVKNNLKRKPRIVYYYPTTTSFMKESHRESFIDYQTRIFSEKIIDRSVPIKVVPVKIPISQFVADPENDSDLESETGLSDDSGLSDNEEHEDADTVSDIESILDVESVVEEEFEENDDYDYADD
jgi:hypothetical protein